MKIPLSYVRSNVAGFVNLLKVCKSMNPQPAILWNSPSLVYGLDTKIPFSGKDRKNQLIKEYGSRLIPRVMMSFPDNLAFYFFY